MLAGYGLFPPIYNLNFVKHPDFPFTDDLEAGLRLLKFKRKNRGKAAAETLVSVRINVSVYFCGLLDVHLMVDF